jgi:HEAT repeat protein
MGADAVEALTEVIAWNDAAARRRAIEALVQIGGARAISALRGIAADPSPAIREEAQRALAVLEKPRNSGSVDKTDAWGQTTLVP